MSRRRGSNSNGGVNLDSLMDALTNVVAVLILVLILVQADVSQKVGQFLEDLMPATPAQVVEAEEKVKELEETKVKVGKLLTEEAPRPEEVEMEKRQLALLEKTLKDNKELLANLNQLKKLEEKARAERDAEAEKTKKIQDDIARLEALLDETKVMKIDPTVVGIPVSRAIPKRAERYHALVISDRVHFIDPFTPLNLFEEEFKNAKRNFPKERIKQRGADRYIYQPGPILKHFEGFDFKNTRKQAVKLRAHPTATRMHIEVTPDGQTGGSSLEELKVKGNSFARILENLSRDSRAVLLFHVHPNSFNTYLEARRLTDKARVAAGWEVRSMGSFSIQIKDLEIKRQQEPPPPPPMPIPGPEMPPILPTKID